MRSPLTTSLPSPAVRPGVPPLQPTPEILPAWTPAPLPAIGSLPGVGQWSPYLQDLSGRTVAYRAYLQPDPQRPYAVAAIVAFDLQATRLHFVLGTGEPASPVPIQRTGKIPADAFKPGVLLAAFNGGFKARHGHFGVMVGGITLLPPRVGFGTVALSADGHVRIGAWGTDIRSSSDLLAWRQNGPLVIQNGQINPHTADTRSQDWGIILNGVTAVWRSGLAISADGRTLYYVAGTSLTLPALVQTLAATGAANALQLDINTTMVHFDAIHATPTGWTTTPLLGVMKPQRDDRFLTGSTRDYFYVTAAEH
jgi:phosphodiester glycosidase